MEINDLRTSDLKIFNFSYNKQENKLNLIINSNNIIYLVIIYLITLKYELQKIHNCNDNNQNNLIINNNNLLNYFVYYTNNNNNSNKKNINFNENDFIKEISKKKNEKETKGTQLIFINLGIKRIRKKILEYSLPSSSYFPSKISYSNNEEEYLLLFACKKYNKNGILLIIPINDKQEIIVEFFEIDFEIHCIFPTTKIYITAPNGISNVLQSTTVITISAEITRLYIR